MSNKLQLELIQPLFFPECVKKKSLKIPKWQSQAVNGRGRDNTMTRFPQNTTQTLRITQHEPHLKSRCEVRCSEQNSYSPSDTRHAI